MISVYCCTQSESLLQGVGSTHCGEAILLPTHTSIHSDLIAYGELMLWEKMQWLEESDHDDRFGSIQDGYCKAMQRAYEAEVSYYITELKNKLHSKKSEGKKYHGGTLMYRYYTVDITVSLYYY